MGLFSMVIYDPSLLSCPSSLTPLIALVFLKHMEFIIQQARSFAISALINCSPLHFLALILSKSTHQDRLMAPHMHQCQPASHDQIRRNGIPYLFFFFFFLKIHAHTNLEKVKVTGMGGGTSRQQNPLLFQVSIATRRSIMGCQDERGLFFSCNTLSTSLDSLSSISALG